jgi:hypothetical protein
MTSPGTKIIDFVILKNVLENLCVKLIIRNSRYTTDVHSAGSCYRWLETRSPWIVTPCTVYITAIIEQADRSSRYDLLRCQRDYLDLVTPLMYTLIDTGSKFTPCQQHAEVRSKGVGCDTTL